MNQQIYLTDPHIYTFKAAMADMPAPVSIITCRDLDGKPIGSTVSALLSLSIDPPMILACFDVSSNTLKELFPGANFMIHILAEGQEKLAYEMAAKNLDKFSDVNWNVGAQNLPKISGCTAEIHCTVGQRILDGDHVIVTGNVQSVNRNDALPLVYHRRSIFPMPIKETQKL